MLPKEDQLGRVTENMKDAGQSKNSMEIEEKTGEGNEKDRRPKSSNRSDNFGKKRKEKEDENRHFLGGS